MAAVPIAPDEQSEIDTVLLVASKVRARGSYSEPFADAVRVLNAVCAQIFHAPDPDATEGAAAGAGWA